MESHNLSGCSSDCCLEYLVALCLTSVLYFQGDNMQKRRSSDVTASKLKDLAQKLMQKVGG